MTEIAYFSVTGQTRRFVQKAGVTDLYEIKRFTPEFPEMTSPFILIVPTYVQPITQPVNDFLEAHENFKYCAGIFGGGNRNFDPDFCFTAKNLSQEFELPLLHLFEFQGNDEDVQKLREEVARFEN